MKGHEDDHAGKLFENRVVALKETLVGRVWGWTHNRADAEDIAQQAICRLIARMERSDSLGNIEDEERFLYVIARNLWRDELRRRRKEPTVSLDSDKKLESALIAATNPLLDLEKATELTALRHRVAEKIIFGGLSDDEIELYKLNQVQGLTPKEIARLKGRDIYWTRYQITKVTAKVRYRIRKIAGEPSS
jgi:RNA polymerase sigma factor (sigma-70 family)